MILDCFARVIRTGGIKTATAAEQRAYGNLIQTQQRDQYRLHSIGARGSRRAAQRMNRMPRAYRRMHARVKSILRRIGRRRRSLAPRDLARHLAKQHLDLGSAQRSQRRRDGARQRGFIEPRGQAQQQIPAVELSAAQTKAFARDPFDEIARRRPRGELFADDEPETGRLAGRPRVDNEMRRAAPRAQTKNG